MRSWQYLLAALLLLLGLGAPVAAAGPLTGYEYYQTIGYAACDQPVYQQDIVVHRSAGTPYEETIGGLNVWHLYVGEDCKSDYGDVRFTNSTGSPLAYYLWPDYTSTRANFTVRLENADQAGTLHVLYGDPAATTTSNGSATFAFFDDYSDPGTLAEYTELYGAHPLYYKSITGGRLHLGWDNPHHGVALLYANRPLSNGQYRIESRFEATGVERYELLRHQKEIGLTTATTPTPAYDDARSAAIEFPGFGGIGIAMPGDGGQTAPAGTEGSAVYTLNATVRYPGIWLQDVGGSESSEIWLDYLLVRAYSATPPAATAFGPEQVIKQIRDSTSNQNHGTIYGATVTQGPLGTALGFVVVAGVVILKILSSWH